MRVPVYRFRANPSTDQWLCKKSDSYVSALVTDRLADWIAPGNVKAGVILRGRVNVCKFDENLQKVAGGGFDSAWSIRQSGYAGPLVWQQNTSHESI